MSILYPPLLVRYFPFAVLNLEIRRAAEGGAYSAFQSDAALPKLIKVEEFLFLTSN